MQQAMQVRAEEKMRVEIKKVADEQLRRYRVEMAQMSAMTGIV